MQPRTVINKNTGKHRTTNKIQESTGQHKNTGIYRIYRTAGIIVVTQLDLSALTSQTE